MTRIHRIIEFVLLIALIAGTILAAWLISRDPGITAPMSNPRGIICTPGRAHFEVMPLDFVGPPKPWPWPRPVAGPAEGGVK
jgi:hypothetical protein